MFKLILAIALLSTAVLGQYSEYSESQEAIQLKSSKNAAAPAGSCSSPCGGKTKIKLEIIVPSGSCGGSPSPSEFPPDVEPPPEDETTPPPKNLCLGSKNSKKISDALLNVLSQNAEVEFNVLKDLLVTDFLYTNIDYLTWAANIQENDFEYAGYPRLKKYVTKYQMCKKVCKVLAVLKKSVIENAANAYIAVEHNEAGEQVITVNGELIVLSDAAGQLAQAISENSYINLITFNTKTFINDDNLLSDVIGGKTVTVNSVNFITPTPVLWDARSENGDGAIYLASENYDDPNGNFAWFPNDHEEPVQYEEPPVEEPIPVEDPAQEEPAQEDPAQEEPVEGDPPAGDE